MNIQDRWLSDKLPKITQPKQSSKKSSKKSNKVKVKKSKR